MKDLLDPNRSYPENGKNLYELIMAKKDNGDKVVIDMEGVTLLPSMFLNVSIGRIAKECGLDTLRSIVSFTRITKAQGERLRVYLALYEN